MTGEVVLLALRESYWVDIRAMYRLMAMLDMTNLKKTGITLHGCWAHLRRKFIEALDTDKRHGTEAIVYISKLYKVESDADETGLTVEQRKEKRVKESYPVIRVFEKWMKDTYPNVLPKSKKGQTIEHGYILLPRLSRYVNDGRISIDNNPVERAIHPLALGRKNWLFCGNDASAYRAAIVHSLIGTCKNASIEPRIWMEDVLKQIPYYQRDGRDLAELLPRVWASKIKLNKIAVISGKITTNRSKSQLIAQNRNTCFTGGLSIIRK